MAVCGSVLQCVAVFSRHLMLRCLMLSLMLQCVAVCGSVLQCVAVCCSVFAPFDVAMSDALIDVARRR